MRKIVKILNYTTVRSQVLDLLANIGLDLKKCAPHSLRSGGASAASNLGLNDRLFKKYGRWKSDKVREYRKYRIKAFSIKEPRPLAIAPTLKYTRLNYDSTQPRRRRSDE